MSTLRSPSRPSSTLRSGKRSIRCVLARDLSGEEGEGADWQYGVVVFRKTGLTDEAHIEFSRYFGELDDVTPYQKAGRTHRLKYLELFDAGNIDP